MAGCSRMYSEHTHCTCNDALDQNTFFAQTRTTEYVIDLVHSIVPKAVVLLRVRSQSKRTAMLVAEDCK